MKLLTLLLVIANSLFLVLRFIFSIEMFVAAALSPCGEYFFDGIRSGFKVRGTTTFFFFTSTSCVWNGILLSLYAIPVVFRVGRHVACVKRKAQHVEEQCVEVDEIKFKTEKDGKETFETTHVGIHGDAIEMIHISDGEASAIKIKQEDEGVSVAVVNAKF